MNDALSDSSESDPSTIPPAAATGSVVWFAVIVRQFEVPTMGVFSERDDAENWIDEVVGQDKADDASLIAFIVDHPELTQAEIAVRLGISEDDAPQELPRVDGSVTKGQFADDFAQMSTEQQVDMAWQIRRNYQGLFAHVETAKSVLQAAGVEDLATHLGVEGDDGDVLRDLFS